MNLTFAKWLSGWISDVSIELPHVSVCWRNSFYAISTIISFQFHFEVEIKIWEIWENIYHDAISMMRNVDIYFLWVFSLLRKSLIYLDNLDWLPDTSHWKTLKIYSFF